MEFLIHGFHDFFWWKPTEAKAHVLGSLYHLSRPPNPTAAIGRFPRTGTKRNMDCDKAWEESDIHILLLLSLLYVMFSLLLVFLIFSFLWLFLLLLLLLLLLLFAVVGVVVVPFVLGIQPNSDVHCVKDRPLNSCAQMFAKGVLRRDPPFQTTRIIMILCLRSPSKTTNVR